MNGAAAGADRPLLDGRRVLFVAPVTPAFTGNGLAMRCAHPLQAMHDEGASVRLIIIPRLRATRSLARRLGRGSVPRLGRELLLAPDGESFAQTCAALLADAAQQKNLATQALACVTREHHPDALRRALHATPAPSGAAAL